MSSTHSTGTAVGGIAAGMRWACEPNMGRAVLRLGIHEASVRWMRRVQLEPGDGPGTIGESFWLYVSIPKTCQGYPLANTGIATVRLNRPLGNRTCPAPCGSMRICKLATGIFVRAARPRYASACRNPSPPTETETVAARIGRTLQLERAAREGAEKHGRLPASPQWKGGMQWRIQPLRLSKVA